MVLTYDFQLASHNGWSRCAWFVELAILFSVVQVNIIGLALQDGIVCSINLGNLGVLLGIALVLTQGVVFLPDHSTLLDQLASRCL